MTRDELYGQCPDCGGNLTHRATDGRCPIRMNTLDMTEQQQRELHELLHPDLPRENCCICGGSQCPGHRP